MAFVDSGAAVFRETPHVSRGSKRTTSWTVVVLAAYAALSLYVYWPASLLSSTQLVGGGTGDPAGQVAGIAWPWYALTHGMSPFFSLWTNYPVGVNLATNPIALPVALLVWPISELAGPIAAFNSAMSFAFFSASVCMYFVLRRFVSHRFSAFIGGLVFGFSPYMIGQGLGHLALVYTCMLPIIFYLLFELFIRQSYDRKYLGVALGCALSLQAYLSIELLADAAFVSVFCIVVFGARYWPVLRTRMRYIFESSAIGIGVFALLSVYLLWYELAGPLHLTGPSQPIAGLDLFHSDLLGLIVPTYLQRFSPHALAVIGSTYAANNRAESGIYVGLPLLVTCCSIVVAMRRNHFVLAMTAMGLFAWVLSLGTRLTINNHLFDVPLPWAIVTHIPLIDGAVPGRYSLFVQMAVAVIFAVGIDQVLRAIRRQKLSGRPLWAGRLRARASHPMVLSGALVLVVLGLLVPIAPSIPLPIRPASVPSLFRSSAVERIPERSVLLAYPYPQPGYYSEAQLWQAVAGYRFKLLGGYGVFLGTNGLGTPWPADLTPPTMQALFGEALSGVALLPGTTNVLPPVPLNRATRLALRAFLEKYEVSTIVVQPRGKSPQLVVRYLTSVVGKPSEISGLSVWFDVPRLLHMRH